MIDEQEVVIHSDEAFSKVAFLNVNKHHLEKKEIKNEETKKQYESPVVFFCEENLIFDFDSQKKFFFLQNFTFFKKCKIFEKINEEKIEMKINETKSKFFGSLFLSASGGSWETKTIEEKTFFYFKTLKNKLKKFFSDTANQKKNSEKKNSENVFESIIHVQVWMEDMCLFEKMNQIYSYFFKNVSLPPSRFCVTLPSPSSPSSSSSASFSLFFLYSLPSSSSSFASLKDERNSLKISSISKW